MRKHSLKTKACLGPTCCKKIKPHFFFCAFCWSQLPEILRIIIRCAVRNGDWLSVSISVATAQEWFHRSLFVAPSEKEKRLTILFVLEMKYYEKYLAILRTVAAC